MTAHAFDAHGSFSLSIEDNIISVHVIGPGNLELIKEYQAKVKPVIDRFDFNNWGTILTLDGMSIYSPEAKDWLIQGNLYAKTKGAIATAAIIKNADYVKLTREFWESVFQLSKTQYDFFETQEEATEWLIKTLKTSAEN